MKNIKGKKLLKFLILFVVVVIVIALFTSNKSSSKEYRTFFAKKGNIESIISGSGTISASMSRKEYAKVSAEITDVYFKEGDEVKSGDLIMKLDSDTYQNTVDSQKIAIEQSKLSKDTIERQIKDLKIIANDTGYITGLTIYEGAYVTNSSPICDISKPSTYEVVLQYIYNENNKIIPGNTAEVTLINSFSVLPGVVTKVSDMKKIINGNSQVIDVTIEVQTNGYSLAGVSAKANVNVGGTVLISSNHAHFSTVKQNTVRAKSMGTVRNLIAYEGMYVNKGDVIAVLENVDLLTNLQNITLTLENQYNQLKLAEKQLENYEVVSPIDGIITMQTYEESDLVAAGTLLTTISNSDVLEFRIPVDELDVAKINYDKEVRVTIDALPETEHNPLKGKITLIPLEGTTMSGITDYYVTIELEGNDDIRISMSANADIVVNSVQDVLYIPIDSVIIKEGKSYVDVLEKDPNTNEEVVITKEITTGVSDTTYIEVVEGLSEGECVIIPTASSMHMPSAGGMMEKMG